MPKRKGNGKREGSLVHDALFYDARVAELSFSAFRLLMELNQQFNGFNNGNLSITPKTLRFDWNDKTLKRAKRELLVCELIEITRPGVKRRVTLYALCHLLVNESRKNGIQERANCTRRARGKREHYFPVKRDLIANVREALDNANNRGVKMTH